MSDPLNNYSSMALPYDPASQVTQILHQLTATSAQINKANYAYNPVGNRCPVRLSGRGLSFDSPSVFTLTKPIFLSWPRLFHHRHKIFSVIRLFLCSKSPDHTARGHTSPDNSVVRPSSFVKCPSPYTRDTSRFTPHVNSAQTSAGVRPWR